MRKRLTSLGVQNYRARKDRYEVPDAGCAGLHLLVHPSGKKVWVVRYRAGRRQRKMTLGVVDLHENDTSDEPVIGQPLTLPAARRLATDILRQRAQGKDPAVERIAARNRATTPGTFDAMAREYTERVARPKNRGWQGVALVLGLMKQNDQLVPVKGSLVERWAGRSVRDITPDEIHAVISEARTLGVPGRGARTRGPSEARARELASALRPLFRWLHEDVRAISANPCAGTSRTGASPKGDRHLFHGREFHAVYTSAGKLTPPQCALVRLLLLTGQRLREVSMMRWEELSDDLRTWTLPGSRTKNKRTHVVPLADAASGILLGLPRLGDYVLTSDGKTSVSGFSKLKKRLDTFIAVKEPWRLHDLRRTAVTGMLELGVQPHIVEAVVNHQSGVKAGVAGVYNHARHDDAKRRALELWAEHVIGEERDNVLRMPR